MRRSAIAVAALAVIALVPAACSSDAPEVTASLTSPPRPELRSELAPEGLEDSLDQFTEEFGEIPGMDEFSEGLDEFGGDIDDMLEQFEAELGVTGECFDLLMRYSELMMSAYGMSSGMADADGAAAQLRAELPADLRDDLQIVLDGIAAIERDGLFGAGAEALSDPAFLDANEAIVEWLSIDCGTTLEGEGA